MDTSRGRKMVMLALSKDTMDNSNKTTGKQRKLNILHDDKGDVLRSELSSHDSSSHASSRILSDVEPLLAWPPISRESMTCTNEVEVTCVNINQSVLESRDIIETIPDLVELQPLKPITDNSAIFDLTQFDMDNSGDMFGGDSNVLPQTSNVSDIAVDINNSEIDNNPNAGGMLDNSNNNSDAVQYTKMGTIRKRKKYELSIKERQKQQHHVLVEQHKVKPGCNNKCVHMCTKNISEERRMFLNSEFWKIDNQMERKSFMLHHVSTVPVKQRTVCADIEFRRSYTFQYMLKDDNGASHIVCKTFFLTTLGYDKKNDKVLRTSIRNAKNSVVPTQDHRGLKEPHNKLDEEPIRQHINSFEPSISHYRREHAPNRLYLPTDLSFTNMYNNFVAKHPNYKCSYEKYRTVVKKMNISIVKLGHEECETCEAFNLHDETHTKENLQTSCDCCNKWIKHIKRADASRQMYAKDKDKAEDKDTIIYCADMEKVIMLPRLEMFKSAIFTNRITVYNESFVPVGKNQKRSKPFAALWHEALFGRSKDELISTFYNFFISKRDTKQIILWLDNCSAQNKNWSLLSFCIYMVNSDKIVANNIILRYFEPGHTFMAADSFHHRVELSMQRMGNKLYDFADFAEAVKRASPHTTVLAMDLNHFFIWEDYSSQYKLSRIQPRPYLHDMVEVEFTRGTLSMQYKNDFNANPAEVNVITSKITKSGILPEPKKQSKVQGVLAEKKKNILKNLSGLIPRNRLVFWEHLAVSD